MSLKSICIENKVLLLILILSFLIRFVGGFIMLDEIPQAYGWYPIAKNIVEGKGTLYEFTPDVDNGNDKLYMQYYSVRPPVYLTFYIILIKFFNSSLFVYLLLQSIFSVLLIIISYKLFLLIFPKKISVIGAAVIGFYPHFITRVWNASEDIVYLIFILLSFYFLIMFLKNQKNKNIYIAGLFLGCAFLTRSTILFFIILLLPFFFIIIKKKRLLIMSKFLGIILLTISPIILHNFITYNKVLISDYSGKQFWVGNNKYIYDQYPEVTVDLIQKRLFNDLSKEDVQKMGSMDHMEQENFMFNKAITFIRENLLLYTKSIIKKAVSSFSFYYHPINPKEPPNRKFVKEVIHKLFYMPLFILGLLGIILYSKNKRSESMIFILFYISLICMAIIYWSQSRHTIVYHITFIYGTLLLFSYNKTIRNFLKLQ